MEIYKHIYAIFYPQRQKSTAAFCYFLSVLYYFSTQSGRR